MVNFPTQICGCLWQSFGFISSCSSICSTVAFPPLLCQFSLNLLQTKKKEAQFHFTAYGYCVDGVDCDGLHDHLRDVP